MSGRRLLGLLFLVLVAMVVAGPALADPCAEDCSPDCGDCLDCAPLADRVAAPVLAAGPSAAALIVLPPAPFASSAPRQLDHVPLPAIG